MKARTLFGLDLRRAKTIIAENHYARSVPSGKSVVIEYGECIIIFSLPANKNIAAFLGFDCVWELSRLWAPDGHERNLLSKALSAGAREFRRVEPAVDALVSYADPNVGHEGGVYKAASWYFSGRSSESRLYRGPDGKIVARRAFHSGDRSLTKSQILGLGFVEAAGLGKLRFVKPLTSKALRLWRKRIAGVTLKD